MSDERHVARAELDASDIAAKPCCKRIDHENVSRFETSVTWCWLPSDHVGQCSGPLPSVLAENHLGPRRPK